MSATFEGTHVDDAQLVYSARHVIFPKTSCDKQGCLPDFLFSVILSTVIPLGLAFSLAVL